MVRQYNQKEKSSTDIMHFNIFLTALGYGYWGDKSHIPNMLPWYNQQCTGCLGSYLSEAVGILLIIPWQVWVYLLHILNINLHDVVYVRDN